jgi:DNA-binding transcriptional MocR family regulator
VLAAGSLSKVAWGGLRVGWLRAPRPVILRLARIKAALNLGVGAFDQLAALTILDDYPQLCLQRRAQAGTQMHTIVNALRRELPDWNIPVAQGGWSLWLSPPAGSGAALAQAALRHGVAITPGAANSPDGAFPEYVRICYGAREPLLEAAAQRLAAAWNDLMTTAPIDSPINA